MNNSILSLQKHQLKDIEQSVYISEQEMAPDSLSISYCPRIKFLYAKWTKNVCSYDLRHTIRLLARAAVLLRAELMLVDLPAVVILNEGDLRWLSSFLHDAMKKSPIRRVARVLPKGKENTEKVRNLMYAVGDLPYETKMFEDKEQAKDWLLEGQDQQVLEDESFRIPLDFNLKFIRKKLLRRDESYVQVAPAQSGQQISPTLPDQLQVRTDFVSIAIDQGKSFMNMHWLKVPQNRQYRYGMLKAIRAVTEHHLKSFLLNNQRLGVLTLENQAWLINTAQHVLPKTKLKKLAIVSSPDSLQQMSSETISSKLKQANPQLETRCYLSEEDAREWLQSDA